MGSGGSNALLPPGKLFGIPLARYSMFGLIDSGAMDISYPLTSKTFGRYMVKPHGQLVLVSFTHYCASTPSLSTL